MDPMFHRRPLARPHASVNDIYVTRRHPMVVYFKRAEALLCDSRNEAIKFYGSGACIPTVLRLTQDIETRFRACVEVSAESSTIFTADDVFGAVAQDCDASEEEYDVQSKERGVSRLTVTIKRI
eukprot:GDKH01002311.1.p1 GENE.GDKH01002311.1~~GDKH01002311.1.p1  ORF type:complete len:124 (+),score=13.40 GDKH01002311.1:68-439(+)